MGSTAILLCRCARARVLPETAVEAVEGALLAAGIDHLAVDDLCGLVARRDSRLATLTEADDLRIVACRPRAVRWLMAAAGASVPESAKLLDLRSNDPDRIAAEVCAPAQGPSPRLPAPLQTEAAWTPWFPVLDRDRCDDCGQCMNFCVFGVYTRTPEHRIEVTRPERCKNRCPACARVCPKVAIIFPKHGRPPIDGSEGQGEEPVAVDLAALASGDVCAILKARAKPRRFSRETDLAQAEAERAACACELTPEQRKILADLGVSEDVARSALDGTP